MKITSIQTGNFLGARAVDVKLIKPIAMFAGKNYQGKSSIQEAVRMALTGESVRVGLKKDYAALITEGQDSGFADVMADGTNYSIVLPSGKGHQLDNAMLSYVLDAQRFASLDANSRRSFLFGLMGLSAGGEAVKKRLIAKKCNEKKIEAIMPLLRAGFDAALKEAQSKAREDKASWRTVTGGETYGEKKAASFKVTKQEVDQASLDKAHADLEEIEKAIEVNSQNLGVMQSRIRQAESQNEKLDTLRQLAGMYARIKDKLQIDEGELKNWIEKVDETRKLASSGCKDGLIHDMARTIKFVVDANDRFFSSESSLKKMDTQEIRACRQCLADYITQHGEITTGQPDHDQDAAAKLLEYEKSLHVLQNAVANGKRDLAQSDAAAQALAGVEDDNHAKTSNPELLSELRTKIDELKHSKGNHASGIKMLEEAARKSKEADQVTAKATALHESIQEWEKVAAALSPDGIPGEMLSEALAPINTRLATSSNIAQWGRINIGADMSIFAAEEGAQPRSYELLSESEKWRADAMIAEAVSHISGLRLLVLDRFDVLDLQGRSDLIAWLDDMAAENEIETALIFGTLKALPAGLPETVQAHWIENGVVGQLKEAA
jgi:hypothetical protein